MMDPNLPRWHFYRQVVNEILHDRSASLLVVCGGPGDRKLLSDLGFLDVTITNLSLDSNLYSPYKFACEDAEDLSFPDGAFDYVVVHAGLHHCQSPHRALLEMYRTCRRGALVFEARDSFLVRLASRLGLSNDYEIQAVARGNRGMRDTCYPNYIYRWTEREVHKAIRSHAPHVIPRIRFFYGLSIPDWRHGSLARRAVLRMLLPIAWLLRMLAPKQGNLFAIYIAKEPDLQPWLRLQSGKVTFDPAWKRQR
jgi:SAM-dependent methyltransferase